MAAVTRSHRLHLAIYGKTKDRGRPSHPDDVRFSLANHKRATPLLVLPYLPSKTLEIRVSAATAAVAAAAGASAEQKRDKLKWAKSSTAAEVS